jgi:Beta-propeller repeat
MNAWKLGLMGVGVSFVLAACSSKGVEVQGTLTRQDFGTASSEQAYDVAAPQGSGTGAVVVGFTDGSLDGPNKGLGDAFIRKYDGGVVWANQFGTRGFERALAVTVTSTGVSYVAGFTNGALGFKVGGGDGFLRKYDANGVVQWTRQFGTTGEDNASDVTLDSSGNIYTLSDDSNTSFTIRKFNASGTLLLTITNTTAGVYNPSAIALDSAGNIFVSTRFYLGGNSFAKIYKYNGAGTLVASPNVYGSSDTVFPYDLVIDSSDNLYFSFSPYNFLSATYKGGYLYKFTNALVKVWSNRIDSTTAPTSIPTALALDSSNNVYVGGTTFGAYTGFTNAGKTDIFVLKYSPSGTRLWARQFGGNDTDQGFGVAVSDAVYMTGDSSSNPNLVGDANYCNCAGSDAFIAQLNPATGAILGIDQ